MLLGADRHAASRADTALGIHHRVERRRLVQPVTQRSDLRLGRLALAAPLAQEEGQHRGHGQSHAEGGDEQPLSADHRLSHRLA